MVGKGSIPSEEKRDLLGGNNVAEDLDYLLCLEVDIEIFFREVSASLCDSLAVVEDLAIDFHDLLS